MPLTQSSLASAVGSGVQNVTFQTSAEVLPRKILLIGTYDPLKDPPEINLKGDRILEWIKKGAQPTGTVGQLLKKGGVFSKENLKT